MLKGLYQNMAETNLREYRRDANRIAIAFEEKYGEITDEKEYNKKLKKYLNGKVKDPDGTFLPKIKDKYIKLTGEKFKEPSKKDKEQEIKKELSKKASDVEYVFVGEIFDKKLNKKVIEDVRYDKAVNKYRDRKGRFVRKL